MYRDLDPDKTAVTIVALQARIDERFPGASLGLVCAELLALAQLSKSRAARLARPYYGLRVAGVLVVVAGLAALIYAASTLDLSVDGLRIGEALQAIEAAVNIMIFVGAGVYFVMTLETRLKRTAALDSLNELRSIAHVIDMHQLTKDPVIPGVDGQATPSSPVRDMTEYELSRYLDYCSEMLSLTGKVAALYAQCSNDGAVATSVNELEVLTTGLSAKIWSKISAIHAAHPID